MEIPALLIRTSRRPNSVLTCEAAAAIESSDETSMVMGVTGSVVPSGASFWREATAAAPF